MSIELNKNQKIAIEHNKGPMLVLAGPGSGKTTVIIHRVKNLIENYNINQEEILVITFTKKAATEMQNRFLAFNNYNKVSFGTFHSYFFRIIKNYYKYELSNILHEDAKIDIIKNIVNKLKISYENQEDFLQNISNEISLVKNELVDINFYSTSILKQPEVFIQIYTQYEDAKDALNKIDFDDMLVKCYYLLYNDINVRKFWQDRYKYILIDEFQDINNVQYRAIRLLLNAEQNLFIVGDDDQSIYSFRGSRPDFLLNFTSDFENAKKVTLNINYRSTEQIINLCNNIITQNKTRYTKDIQGTGTKFKLPLLFKNYDINEEAKNILKKILHLQKKIPLEEIAIIYRTNLQARAIIEAFMDHNIEYQVKDSVQTIYDHFVVKDIICYLKLALNNLENDVFLKIANKPKRYFSKILLNDCAKECGNKKSIIEHIYFKPDLKTWQLEKINELIFHLNQIKTKEPYSAIKYILEKVSYKEYLEEYAEYKKINSRALFEIAEEFLESSKEHKDILQFLTYIDDMSIKLKEYQKNTKNNKGVVLSTIHSAKGLEFEAVFVISCIEGIIPHEKSKSEQEIEEERRLFYVALTRAKKILYISILKTKYSLDAKPSRFLKNLIK